MGFVVSTITECGVEWRYLDEAAFIQGNTLEVISLTSRHPMFLLQDLLDQARVDAYARNKFNQVASDKVASNRDVPDTRSGSCKVTGDLPTLTTKAERKLCIVLKVLKKISGSDTKSKICFRPPVGMKRSFLQLQ